MVGLGNADNTSDVNKPVSTAQQAALNLKLNSTGGTLTNGVGDMLFLRNGDGTTISFPGNTYAVLSSNRSGGLGGADIISSGHAFPLGDACRWYTRNDTAGFNLLMRLTTPGNLSVVGTIASPTISAINASIAAKQDAITSSSRLDASLVGTGVVSTTEYNHLDGVTSPIQTQLNAKAPSSNATMTGTTLEGTTTIFGTLVLNGPVGRICRAWFQLCNIGGTYSFLAHSGMRQYPGGGYTEKPFTGNVRVLINRTSTMPSDLSWSVTATGTIDDDEAGNNNIIIGVCRKQVYMVGGVYVADQFTLTITRVTAPGTRVDLTDYGRIDCAIFW